MSEPREEKLIRPGFQRMLCADGDKVVLLGKYAMATTTVVFMVLWLIGAASAFIALVLALFKNPSLDVLIFALFGAGMLAFGVWLPWKGTRWTSEDKAWLSTTIKEMLRA